QSYISILRCAAVLFFAGIVYLMREREKKAGINGGETVTNIEEEKEWYRRFWFYTYLNLGAFVLYVFCSFLPIISRIGYYLMVSQIVFLPMLLKAVPDKKWRRLFRAGILLAAVLYFAMYLKKGANDGVLILPYKTFFFHEMVDILSDVT
ncbi:MAG: EpsG family protein, partial [Lachnospiraceae bacterium]|nr:EpsG family protein [Lachnospiraceae bacterium]